MKTQEEIDFEIETMKDDLQYVDPQYKNEYETAYQKSARTGLSVDALFGCELAKDSAAWNKFFGL